MKARSAVHAKTKCFFFAPRQESAAACDERAHVVDGVATLELNKCHALMGLPGSLGLLAALTTLKLGDGIIFRSGCAFLTALPESPGQLAALRTLILRECDAFLLHARRTAADARAWAPTHLCPKK
jgi:hypothetical protein